MSEPAQGMTLRARGAGKGPKSEIFFRTSPATSPAELFATALICARNESMPLCPAPDAA